MTKPKLSLVYERTDERPYAVEFHAPACRCAECTPPPLPLARLTIAGILVGNAIAFAVDPAGSWSALAAAVRHLVGA